jgi:hypothetical protein
MLLRGDARPGLAKAKWGWQLELCGFGFGGLQDGDAGVSGLPRGEKVLIGG